jgi:exonuclease SbcD
VEVEYSGEKIISNLKEILFEMIENSKVEILKISNRQLRISLADFEERDNLEEMDHLDVFQKLLDGNRIEKDQQEELTEIYRELTNTIYEEDSDEDC